jgi:hypothetical protein
MKYVFGLAMAALVCGAAAGAEVRICPAPAGVPMSKDYTATVDGKACPVYAAKVAPADQKSRWAAMDDKKNSADYFAWGAFTTFDMTGRARVMIACQEPVTTARILPSSLGIRPAVKGNTVSFTLSRPSPVTLEVNGKWVSALHLFANPPETDAPRPNDPNVIYFGPGVHEVSHMLVGNGKTVYLAGGAVVCAVIRPDEPSWISSYSGLKNYSPTFELRGNNITFRGRGVLDCGALTTHSRNPIFVSGSDIKIEGITILDAPTWTIPIRQSDRVTVKNVKLIGKRANSDGIDICNSRDVTVEGCFIRTLDDLIVVKSDKGQGPVRRIVAKDCVLWNEVAHALSVGAELQEDVDGVLFANCDIIHDKGREWSLRVYHCDAARVSNIRFENIRLEESPRFISLWIGKAVWSRDKEAGRIDDVVFKDIRLAAPSSPIELTGFDETHQVANVVFDGVTLGGKPLSAGDVKSNAFVRSVTIRP